MAEVPVGRVVEVAAAAAAVGAVAVASLQVPPTLAAEPQVVPAQYLAPTQAGPTTVAAPPSPTELVEHHPAASHRYSWVPEL